MLIGWTLDLGRIAYGWLPGVSEAKRLKAAEDENAKLKKLAGRGDVWSERAPGV